jgi:thiol-disulfide isomerase/thioredoxin
MSSSLLLSTFVPANSAQIQSTGKVNAYSSRQAYPTQLNNIKFIASDSTNANKGSLQLTIASRDRTNKDNASDSESKDNASDSVSKDNASDSVSKDNASDSVSKDNASDSVSKDNASDSVSKDKLSSIIANNASNDTPSANAPSNNDANNNNNNNNNIIIIINNSSSSASNNHPDKKDSNEKNSNDQSANQIKLPAHDNDSTESTSESRQKGEAILDKVSTFYSKLKGFSCELAIDTDIKLSSGNPPLINLSAIFDIALKRPNKLAIVQNHGAPVLDLHSDGKDMTIYSGELNKYLVLDVPNTARQELHDPAFRGGLGCLKDSALETLLADKPQPWTSFSAVTDNTEVAFMGEDTIDGTPVDRLRIKAAEFVEFLYVERGAQPWLRQVTTFDTNVAHLPLPGNGPKLISLSSHTRYKHWSAAVPGESKFKFEAPSGAAKVDSFRPQEPPSPLVGKAEMDFDGELLVGKPIKLHQFKGKKVVMLDFWATWCGPCRAALPIVAQVANDYKKKGVALFTVNENDEASKVQEFLTSTGLNVEVILDHKSVIGAQYGANANPLTIIIDKKGIIRAVHRGYSPEIGMNLKTELDKILGLKKRH